MIKAIEQKKISKLLLSIFFIFFLFSCKAQNNRDSEIFEQKLDNFRYSLYETIDTIADIDKFFNATDTSHILLKKIDNFLTENKKEMFEYRENILDNYKDNNIDFNSFTKDSLFMNDIDTFNNILHLQLDNIVVLYNFITINPFGTANLFINIYSSRKYSVSEYSKKLYYDKIANPRIKTEKENNNKWKVWIDKYSELFEFEYNSTNGQTEFLGVYNRNK